MSERETVALIAAVLLAADRVRRTVYYARSDYDGSEWHDTTDDEAITAARELLALAGSSEGAAQT